MRATPKPSKRNTVLVLSMMLFSCIVAAAYFRKPIPLCVTETVGLRLNQSTDNGSKGNRIFSFQNETASLVWNFSLEINHLSKDTFSVI